MSGVHWRKALRVDRSIFLQKVRKAYIKLAVAASALLRWLQMIDAKQGDTLLHIALRVSVAHPVSLFAG